MPAPAGFLSALGMAFRGYADDEDTRLKRAERSRVLGLEQGAAARATELHGVQLQNIRSEIAARNAKPVVAPHYDSDRGGFVTPGQPFSPVAGAPPKPPPPRDPASVPGSPEWQQTRRFDAALGEQSHQRNRDYDAAHPTTSPDALSPSQENQVRLQQTALLNLRKAIKALRDEVETNGVTLIPGAGKARISSLVSNARIQYKEAANLGVLAGPDMGLIDDALGNPTSAMQYLRGGKDGALSGLDAVNQTLTDRARTIETIYGVKMPDGFHAPVAPKTPTAPAGGALPPLSAADKAEAARDTKFAAWLRTQGYP